MLYGKGKTGAIAANAILPERLQDTYGLKETDGMYVPPEQTIAIW